MDGPVSSIRFELLREGIEDYEYLWMLRSLGDEAFADEIVHSMVATVGAFSRDPDRLYVARQRWRDGLSSSRVGSEIQAIRRDMTCPGRLALSTIPLRLRLRSPETPPPTPPR